MAIYMQPEEAVKDWNPDDLRYSEPETINKFLEEYTFERIEEWFNKLITGFKRWTDYTFDERHKRRNQSENLSSLMKQGGAEESVRECIQGY